VFGGLGILRGQYIGEVAFLSSALQFRRLHEEILGQWEAPMHPAIAVARAEFFNLVGDFDESLLDSPDFDTSGFQGKLALGGGAVRRAVGRKEASYWDISAGSAPLGGGSNVCG
jgi:hypothetical protein